MIDPVPDTSQRLAFALGYILHPFPVSVVTLAVILQEVPWRESLFWMSLFSAITFLPVWLVVLWGERQKRFTYQRWSRTPIYLVGWLSFVACEIVAITFDAPDNLRIAYAALLLWLPLQFAVNVFYTKISAHAAAMAACMTGLYLFGFLTTRFIQVIALFGVFIIGWARTQTQNHTREQVVLGWLVGSVSIWLTFLVML